jgi:phosphohistidine phosphatase
MLPARVPLDPDFRRYPTAATLVVDFQVDSWDAVQPGQGSVMDFVRLDGRR